MARRLADHIVTNLHRRAASDVAAGERRTRVPSQMLLALTEELYEHRSRAQAADLENHASLLDDITRLLYGPDYSQYDRKAVKRAVFPLLYGADALTSPVALAAFREAWERADAAGDKGNRVRRGMIAAIEAAS